MILFLLFKSANAQQVYQDFLHPSNTNLSNKSYVGNVKKVNRFYYDYHLNLGDSNRNNNYIDSFQREGKLLFSKHYSTDSTYNSITNYQYNSFGNCISIVGRYLSNDSVFHEGYNAYNIENQLVNSKTYNKGKLMIECNFTYNKNGDIESREILTENYCLEKIQKNDNKTTVISYNIAGKKTMKQEYFEDDTSIYCHYYSYQKNSASGTEGETRIYKKDNLIFYSFKRDYDYNIPNQNWCTIETKYDENKNLIKLVTYDKLKKVSYTSKIQYKYDTIGNIIEKLITYDNGDTNFARFCFEYY